MTIKTQVTCNKCGRQISEHDSHWTATFNERRDPDAPVPAVYLHPQPDRVDICTECVRDVLGPLINHARADGRTKDGRDYWM